MPQNSYKLIAFDLDGTLVDSMGDFARVAADVMQEFFGMPREQALTAYRETSGLPFRYQLEKIFPGDTRIEAAAEAYEQAKIRDYQGKDFFADVVPAIAELRNQGYRLAVSSNNHEANVHSKMASCEAYFDDVLGFRPGFFKGEDHFQHLKNKYGLASDDILFVGDSLNDGRVARKSGVGFVARAGTFHPDEFAGIDVLQHIGDLSELCRWLADQGEKKCS